MDANKIREIRLIRENPRFRRYPEYKDSGVEWIGKIPKHWRKSRLKYESLVPVQYGLNINSDLYVEQGIRFIRTTDITDDGELIDKGVYLETESVEEIYLTQPNDFLISRSGTLGRTYLHQSDENYTYGGYLVRFNFGCSIKSRFIFYFTKSRYFEHWITLNTVQSTIGNVNGQKYSNLEIPLPSFSEQTQIVNFLDHKTQQIDELIRIKERRIELLQAQRTTLVNQAVTKGLDPNVEMKPSGVEWIGEIPVHWKISKVKHEFESLDNLRVPLNSETRGSMELKVYDYYGASGIIDKVENYIFDEPLILIGEDGANLQLRSTPLAFKATGKYWVNNHAHVLRPKHGIIDYLTNMLESLDYTHYITGAAQPKLTSEHLMNITVIIPPSLEQDQIANYLNHKTKQIDELIATEHRKIELLKEYRQSLISEAVTGKIDVRNEV